MQKIVLADLTLMAHASAIIYLLNEYAKDDMGGGMPLSPFVHDNLIAELNKRHGVHVVLAFDDSIPTGLTICLEGFSTFSCKPLLNIHDIIVIKAYRGRGIAKRMLAKAEEIAINKGCCKLTLEVLEGNTVAQTAYMTCGFAGYELDPEMGKAMFWQKKLR